MAATLRVVLRDVWGDSMSTTLLHEITGVVSPVGAHRDPVRARHLLEHLQCDLSLGAAVRLLDTDIDDKAIAVLHQDVARETQLRLLS